MEYSFVDDNGILSPNENILFGEDSSIKTLLNVYWFFSIVSLPVPFQRNEPTIVTSGTPG